MKVSLNTIRGLNSRYGCAGEIAPDGADEVARKIGAQLGAIEEVADIGAKYRGLVIAKVVSCERHPNADKLNVCMVDDGGRVQDVARDDSGHVQVVCGAPNVRAGLTVVWLPPGSTVPESVGREPFVLGSRELRGVVSHGMLASPRELALGDSHDGILEIDEEIAPGTDFAEHYGLAGDVIFDIENKMFTHRPDCFGYLGIARELAGIQQMLFASPAWYRMDAGIPEIETEVLPLTVRNELPELVPRFTAIALRDVQVKASPVWLQIALVKHGLRPVNNIVDYTNFFMLETGQPLHAYDYDKLRALDGGDTATLVVRHPRPDEQIALLNGKTVTPRAEAVMIATAKRLVGIGGIMGGADTEVDETTKHIAIEAATFDMYSIRRTSMAHGLFTDAVTRFNKGQSPLQNRAVQAKIVDEIRRFAGGKVASQFIDDNHLPDEVMARGSLHPPVAVPAAFVNERLGLQLPAEAMAELLRNVEFDVRIEADQLVITAPFWRTDIEIPEDIVEEVGRLYGYDRLPLVLPRRDIVPAGINRSLALKQRLRQALAKAGASEVLTYSFVHGKLLAKAGQDPAQAFQLSNALSPDLQYYRLSLTPSLLDKVHANIKAGYDEYALFEVGKAHVVGQAEEDGLPTEYPRLALVYAANPKAAAHYDGAAYFQARLYLETVLHQAGVSQKLTYRPIEPDETDPAAACFEPGRAATVMAGDRVLGRVGEYRPAVRQAFKLPEYCAGFEIGLAGLEELAATADGYQPLPRFPKVEQDICLRVPAGLPYDRLYDFVAAQVDELQPEHARSSLTPVDIYQRQDDQSHKQVTLRLSIASYQKTLRDSEVAGLLDAVARATAAEFQAERV